MIIRKIKMNMIIMMNITNMMNKMNMINMMNVITYDKTMISMVLDIVVMTITTCMCM